LCDGGVIGPTKSIPMWYPTQSTIRHEEASAW